MKPSLLQVSIDMRYVCILVTLCAFPSTLARTLFHLSNSGPHHTLSLELGTPPVAVDAIIDTGSSDLIVRSGVPYAPENSTTATMLSGTL